MNPIRIKHLREYLTFLAFVAPNLVLFAAFTYWPIVYSVYLSFMEWTGVAAAPRWVGVRNYLELLRDPVFWRVVVNTVVYAVVVVGVAQVAAFALALVLNARPPGHRLLKTLAFTPYVTMPAAAAVVWVLIMDPKLGPLGVVYEWSGATPQSWLMSPRLALWAVVAFGVWREIAFATVFFLAGLQGLPLECYEAARIDGSSRLATLRHLTLPLMTPVIFFLLVSGLIAAGKVFDIVAILTEGGPVYPASSTYVFHLYRLAFREFDFGHASALATLFFIAMVILTAGQLRLARRWVHYGG